MVPFCLLFSLRVSLTHWTGYSVSIVTLSLESRLELRLYVLVNTPHVLRTFWGDGFPTPLDLSVESLSSLCRIRSRRTGVGGGVGSRGGYERHQERISSLRRVHIPTLACLCQYLFHCLWYRCPLRFTLCSKITFPVLDAIYMFARRGRRKVAKRRVCKVWSVRCPDGGVGSVKTMSYIWIEICTEINTSQYISIRISRQISLYEI